MDGKRAKCRHCAAKGHPQLFRSTLWSEPLERRVLLAAIPPEVTSSPGSTSYVEDAPPVVVDGAVNVMDLDSANLAGATVSIIDGFAPSEDVLAFAPSTVSMNIARYGGGVLNEGSLILTDSTVSLNEVRGATGNEGGGIYNNAGTATLNNSTVAGNAAEGHGAGIGNYNGNFTLIKSIVSGNAAGDEGGGISRLQLRHLNLD